VVREKIHWRVIVASFIRSAAEPREGGREGGREGAQVLTLHHAVDTLSFSLAAGAEIGGIDGREEATTT